jgi:hypothetical protein
MRSSRTVITACAVCFLIAGTAAADITIHEKHRFDARPGATVVVDVSFHSVEVTSEPGDTVDVVVDIEVEGSGGSAKNIANDLQPKFLEEGNRLIIRSTRKGWNWKQVKARGKVLVNMPPGMNLSIDSSSGSARVKGDFGDAVVRFDASSGSLTVDGAMGELHTDTSSGSIRAAVMRPLHSFTADASSGSVRLVGGARDAQVDTSSGSIRLAGLLGNGSFDASSGSITAQWKSIPPGSKVQADASSGSVTLSFPAGTVVAGTVDVSSGSIRTDFPGTMKKKHVDFAGGPGEVTVHVGTSSGSVKVLGS